MIRRHLHGINQDISCSFWVGLDCTVCGTYRDYTDFHNYTSIKFNIDPS